MINTVTTSLLLNTAPGGTCCRRIGYGVLLLGVFDWLFTALGSWDGYCAPYRRHSQYRLVHRNPLATIRAATPQLFIIRLFYQPTFGTLVPASILTLIYIPGANH